MKPTINMTGTPLYASINTMNLHEQSRRDDLESLAYCFIHLLKGSLPWESVSDANPLQLQENILRIKEKITPKELCSGLPKEFRIFLEDVRSLGFAEEPDYHKYQKMFQDLFNRKQYIMDYKYDWFDEKDEKDDLSNINIPSPREKCFGIVQKKIIRLNPINIRQQQRQSPCSSNSPTNAIPFSNSVQLPSSPVKGMDLSRKSINSVHSYNDFCAASNHANRSTDSQCKFDFEVLSRKKKQTTIKTLF